MDRLFDVNLTVLPPWTDGNEWDDANPAQEIERVYRRVFSTSEEDAPEYRIDPGDNFFIGAHPTEIVDWTPRTLPWTFDIQMRHTRAISKCAFALWGTEAPVCLATPL